MKKGVAFFLCLLLVVFLILPVFSAEIVHSLTFDDTDIMDDLRQISLGSDTKTITSDGETQMVVPSKNLANLTHDVWVGASNPYGGVMFQDIDVASGSFTFYSAGASVRLSKVSDFFPYLEVGETYTLSGTSTGNYGVQFYFVAAQYLWAAGGSVTITQTMLDGAFMIYTDKAGGVSVTYTGFQIEVGTGATAFEPFGDKVVVVPGEVDTVIKGDKHIFDPADYPKDENATYCSIIYPLEYGFGTEDFALYLYVYNPSGRKIWNGQNKVQIATAWDNSANAKDWAKYTMMVCSYSSDYLYYKFRVLDQADVSGKTMAERMVSRNAAVGNRVYQISGIELSLGGSVDEFVVANTYTYTGAGDTLRMVGEASMAVSLDVSHTFYRFNYTSIDGTIANPIQKQLNSCWFSVPDALESQYKKLTGIEAGWDKEYLKPILLFRDPWDYNLFAPYKDHDLGGSYIMDFDYFLFNETKDDHSLSGKDWNYAYNAGLAVLSNEGGALSNYIDSFNFLYNTNFVDFRDFVVPRDVLLADIDRYMAFYDGTPESLPAIFESGGEGWQIYQIFADDSFDVTVTARKYLDLIFFKIWLDTEDQTVSDIQKFVAVNKDSFVYKYGVIDVAASAEKLYMQESDVAKLYLDYEKAQKNNESIWLVRYDVSDYQVIDLDLGTYSHDWWEGAVKSISKGAAQWRKTAVYLDFDIIDIMYTDECDQIVKIPVIMKPQTVVGDLDDTGEWEIESVNPVGANNARRVIAIALLVVLGLVLFFVGDKIFVIVRRSKKNNTERRNR